MVLVEEALIGSQFRLRHKLSVNDVENILEAGAEAERFCRQHGVFCASRW